MLGTVGVLYPDAMEARTGIGRMGKRLAPVMIPVGLAYVVQSIVRIWRGALKVDGSGIYSPFYWSMARGTVQWSDVRALEPVGAPYGNKRGVRVRAKEGRGIVIPSNLLECGEQLEEDLRRRLAGQQSHSPPDS